MDNWIPISDVQYRLVWGRFYKDFNFKPSVHSSDWPSFHLPIPFVTFDITEYTDEDIDDLEEKCVTNLRAVTGSDEFIYALDWHHDCYLYNPHLENSNASRRIGFYPDGDYSFYLHKDFKWGYLGHPWEQSISIFGEELIHHFERNRPTIFGKIVRSNR
ncbi:DUF2716 domain-containing protein [Brevibacillus brevis]|uniref:DUF2716 domain-containing protein n=1 Tax=Brevibacillus brevis TaxID=1393 RepID=UPI000D10C45F|nr:DUF2716 domain-containing protein [Brevibacillus brevis]PSJ70225.1 sugar epimerase [Brevibacillus brevis]RED30107.1 uncharacterized protein DUF2716 [Brevibacillus brevis]GEC88155.1 hypothetical protein BBR01nite_04860 [Brevibacillus brevis]VEF88654.1 Protein of uncharacterised function (DUF2716) [Brevibacillus brevis]